MKALSSICIIKYIQVELTNAVGCINEQWLWMNRWLYGIRKNESIHTHRHTMNESLIKDSMMQMQIDTKNANEWERGLLVIPAQPIYSIYHVAHARNVVLISIDSSVRAHGPVVFSYISFRCWRDEQLNTPHIHTHTKQQWPIAKHTPRLHSKSMQNSPLVPVGISTIRATAAYGILMWVICMIGWRHFSCSERSQVSVGDEQGQKLAWPPGLPCNKYAIFFGMFLRDGTHIEYVHNDRKQCVQIDMQSACSGGEKI